MCGIVGLHLKNAELESHLGEFVVPMLDLLASRGPDSTGVAVYRAGRVRRARRNTRSVPRRRTTTGAASRLSSRRSSPRPVTLRRKGRDAIAVTEAPSISSWPACAV